MPVSETESPKTLQTASDEHMASQDPMDLDGSDTIDEFFTDELSGDELFTPSHNILNSGCQLAKLSTDVVIPGRKPTQPVMPTGKKGTEHPLNNSEEEPMQSDQRLIKINDVRTVSQFKPFFSMLILPVCLASFYQPP